MSTNSLVEILENARRGNLFLELRAGGFRPRVAKKAQKCKRGTRDDLYSPP